ncbi:MAG TPA: hypothetical protein VKQ54_07435 [Caulobacteraceae bacterium]|nr:hypothetical protein [Caulobacteraceae bacterium]
MKIQDLSSMVPWRARAPLFRTCSTVALGAAAAMNLAAAPAELSDAAKAQYLATHMANVHAWSPSVEHKPTLGVSARYRSAARGALGAIQGTSGGPPPLGTTVPYWTTSITSPLDGATYTVSMVGSSPYAPVPTNTNVTYVPTAVRIHLDGFVLDPTAVSHCDTQSPARRFFNSPIFRPTGFISNGVNVSKVPGGTQLISAFQRANFWKAVQGTNYGVTLTPSRLDTIIVDWFPSDPQDFIAGVPDNCGGVVPIAVVNINEFNNELLAIAAAYATPAQVPVTLDNDVAIYVGNNTNNCCVLGYHNAVPVPGGTQLYAVGAYFDTNGVFGPDFADTTIWAHELGELIDDPFVQSIPGAPGGTANDLTPAWGHTGQVFGCQNNLEVGDPLTPDQAGHFKTFPIVGVGGFIYHYQDLAFHDWFYRTASTSTGGAGSFRDRLAGGGQPTICS